MNERNEEGIIRKASSGFYYVQCGQELVTLPGPGENSATKNKLPWWGTGWPLRFKRMAPVR